MLTASVYRCARHQSVHRVFVLLFQCVCVLTLFSTACYIVDIRSRYLTPRKDFHALNIFAKSLWNASGLPATVVPAPSLHAAAIQAYDEPVLLQLNASLTRTGAAAAAIEGYGLERTECLWSALLDPAARPSPAPSNLSLHLHVFFLHGNSGSHTQGEYWSCAVRFASSLLGLQISTYAFQWAEQANVHRGRLVGLQADYVADVVEAVVRGAPDRSVVHQAWLVGHSMGGVVARLAAQLLDTSVELSGIVTFNAPHRFPPLLLDAAMADVYHSLTASERVTPTNAAGEEAAERPTQLSSAKLLEVCRASTADCLRYRRRQSRAVQLISISSGEMDLQIEPATASVSQRSSYYVVSVLNTLNRDLCTRTTSHDGVLAEPCTVMLGALRLLAASVNQMTSSAVPADGQRRARDAEAEALVQLLLPPGIVSRVSLLGQLLWQWHLWPWAVAALYGYVLFAGLWPGMVHAAEHFALRGPARRASPWLVVSAIRWVVSSDYTVAVFLVIFYGCTTAYAAVTGLYLVCSGETEWFSTTSPWQWESYPQLRHLTATYAAPLQLTTLTLLFLVLSVGPVTVGINAGMTMLVIGDAVRHVKGRIGRWRRVFGTARRRRVAAALFPGVVAAVYVALLLLEIGLTARAMVWLVLFLVVPSFRNAQASRSERVATPVATATDAVEVVVPAEPSSARAAAEVEEWPVRHLPGMLYAAVFLVQLHPFFTLRNVVVSHTFDEVSTVDARNFVAEVGLLVLLCCAAATPPLQMRDSRVWRYAGALSSAAAALAVAWMMVHPVEAFLVLPALLWCLPSFLFSTLCA